METIFDHNITKEEISAILGPLDWTREDFENDSQESNYGLIYRLYSYRGDDITAKKYLDLIPNNVHKIFGLCNHDVVTSSAEFVIRLPRV